MAQIGLKDAARGEKHLEEQVTGRENGKYAYKKRIKRHARAWYTEAGCRNRASNILLLGGSRRAEQKEKSATWIPNKYYSQIAGKGSLKGDTTEGPARAGCELKMQNLVRENRKSILQEQMKNKELEHGGPGE